MKSGAGRYTGFFDFHWFEVSTDFPKVGQAQCLTRKQTSTSHEESPWGYDVSSNSLITSKIIVLSKKRPSRPTCCLSMISMTHLVRLIVPPEPICTVTGTATGTLRIGVAVSNQLLLSQRKAPLDEEMSSDRK